MENLMTDKGIALEYFLKLRKYNSGSKATFLFICLKEEIDSLLTAAQHHTSAIIILHLSGQGTLDRLINNNIFVRIYDKTRAFENIISQQMKSSQEETFTYDPKLNICVLLQIGSNMDDGDISIQQMVKKNKKSLFISGFYKMKIGKHFVILSDKTRKITLSNNMFRHIAILIRGGYGDLVMLLPILQSFIHKQKTQKIRVDVITPIARVYKFLKSFLPDCNIIYFDLPSEDTFYIFLCSSFLSAGYYRDIYTITPNVIPNIKESLHITDIWKTVLGISNEGFVSSKGSNFPIIPECVLRMIQQKKSDGFFCVGIQLYAENKNYKSWPKSHVLKFIDLCKNERIFLINLVPNIWETPLNVYDVSFLDFNQLFALIKHMDMVVGIDGCCGHMAGVFKVPNMTIWGYDLPHCVETRPISFRSISMNYSLVSKDRLASSIVPELVFERLIDFQKNKIQLQETLITIDDTLHGKNIECV